MRHYFLAFIGAITMFSCVKNEVVPAKVEENLIVSPDSIKVANTKATTVVQISINHDWTVSCDKQWLNVYPESGTSATQSITLITTEDNTAEKARVALLTFIKTADPSKTAEFKVIQRGADESFNGHIYDAKSLQMFLEAAGSFVEGDLAELDCDVDAGGMVISPVASYVGTLDGNGHCLYNFTVKSTGPSAGFIVENKGVIKDIKIGSSDGKVWDKKTGICFDESVTEGVAAGFVAINSGKMENVSNFAEINFNAASTASDAAVGGVAGTIGSSSASVKNCNNYGSVSYTGVQGARSSMGGVIGFNSQAGFTMESCVNYGSISKTTNNAKEFSIAGVLGRAQAQTNIVKCSNEGRISNEYSEVPTTYIHIAGICGYATGGNVFTECTNKGEIYSSLLQVNRIGGICGTAHTGATFDGCVNSGNITVNQLENANWQGAGGIIGFEEKSTATAVLIVKNCVNKGAVTLNLKNSTTHNNKLACGGIIGSSCSVVQYENNTNEGKISGTNTGTSPIYVGGVLGFYRGGSSLTCTGNTNKGDVKATTGDGAAGGVFGNVSVASSSIKEEKNNGSVSCSIATASGSIAGLSAASLKSCSCGGSVNGTELTESNFSTLIQGSASTGSPVSCYFAGGSGPSEYITVAPGTLTFIAAGGSNDVKISANCAWSATSSEGWLTLSQSTGEGDLTITLTAEANSVKASRTAKVTVVSTTKAEVKAEVSITQDAKTEGLPGNKISSDADLKTFFALAPNAEMSDVYTLETDVTLSGEFTPASSFAGTLDGKNHTITLNVEKNEKNLALIQTLTGTVKNLKTGGSIKSTYDGNTEYALAAMVVTLDGGLIDGCANSANVTDAGTSTGAYANVGGVVAYVKGDGAAVKNCSNSGKIKIVNKSQTIAGGVVAYGQTNADAPTLTFEQLVNTGDFEADHEGANWDYLGGVIGKMGASSNPFTKFYIKNCSNSGKFTITKAPKTRGGGVFASCGVSSDYEISGCTFSGEVNITDSQAVDRCIAAVGPGFSEGGATGTISNCTFCGKITAVDGGNLYLGGIYGNNGSANIVIDGCKTTSTSSITGFTKAKSVGMIAARPNKAGFTIKNCKIAGKVVDVTAESAAETTITADNLAYWMIKGSATTVEVTLSDNVFNDEK